MTEWEQLRRQIEGLDDGRILSLTRLEVARLLATVDAAEQRATDAEALAAHYESALKSIAKGIWIAKADACLDTIGFIAREALRKAVQGARDAISGDGK